MRIDFTLVLVVPNAVAEGLDVAVHKDVVGDRQVAHVSLALKYASGAVNKRVMVEEKLVDLVVPELVHTPLGHNMGCIFDPECICIIVHVVIDTAITPAGLPAQVHKIAVKNIHLQSWPAIGLDFDPACPLKEIVLKNELLVCRCRPEKRPAQGAIRDSRDDAAIFDRQIASDIKSASVVAASVSETTDDRRRRIRIFIDHQASGVFTNDDNWAVIRRGRRGENRIIAILL